MLQKNKKNKGEIMEKEKILEIEIKKINNEYSAF